MDVASCISGLFGFLVLTALSGGCRKGDDIPVSAYNDRIVSELERASRRMAAFYAGPEMDTAHLAILEQYIQATRLRVSAIPPYREDPGLRDEAVNLLDFYERLCMEQSRSLVNLTGDQYYTIEDSLLVRRIVASILVEENRYNSRLRESQERFAREHGLLLVRD